MGYGEVVGNESVHWVVQNGRVFEGQRLDEVGAHPKPRSKFWWEEDGGSAVPGAATDE